MGLIFTKESLIKRLIFAMFMLIFALENVGFIF